MTDLSDDQQPQGARIQYCRNSSLFVVHIYGFLARLVLALHWRWWLSRESDLRARSLAKSKPLTD